MNFSRGISSFGAIFDQAILQSINGLPDPCMGSLSSMIPLYLRTKKSRANCLEKEVSKNRTVQLPHYAFVHLVALDAANSIVGHSSMLMQRLMDELKLTC